MKFTLAMAAAAMALSGLSNVRAAAAAGISEVVVTAQRVESLATRTPLALTVLTAADLRAQEVSNPARLADAVPNLAVTDKGGALQITIRGVTSTDASEKGDPSAAFLIDGVYIARPQAQDVSFYDLARVEVLRGPQGTLYGRNATAGAINLVSNTPSRDFELSGEASAGDFASRRFTGMINVPVNDRVQLRAAVVSDRRDSVLRTAAGDPTRLDPARDDLGGRLQAQLQFSEALRLRLKFDYTSMKGLVNDTNVPLSAFYDLSIAAHPVWNPARSTVRRTLREPQAWQSVVNDHTWGLQGELTWNVGAFQATWLAAYRELQRSEPQQSLDLGLPTAFLPQAQAQQFFGHYWQHSQELRLATTGDGPVSGQVGAYYFHEQSAVLDLLPNAPLPGNPLTGFIVPYYGFQQDPTRVDSYALFGQGRYALAERLRATLGGRFTHDRKEREGGTVLQEGFDFNPATDLRFLNSAHADSSKLTGRAGLEWDAAPGSLLYATVSTGYKAGGFNDGCEAGSVLAGQACNQVRPASALYYQPETLTAYEAGDKTRLQDGRLQFGVAAFYYRYRNLQLSAVTTFNGAPAQTTLNAGAADVKGAEFEGAYAPDHINRLDLAATWLDAAYTDYRPLPTVDFSGRALDRSPHFTLSAGYTLTLPVGSAGEVAANVRGRWTDRYVLTDFTAAIQYPQPGYFQTDARVTYTAAHEAWYLSAYAHNLENRIALTGVTGYIAGTGGYGTIIEPRVFGVSLGFRR